MDKIDAGDDEDDGRPQLDQTARLALVERDLRSHARSLTGIVTQLAQLNQTAENGFTVAQQQQLKAIIKDELGDIGLKTGTDAQVDDQREDLRFLRQLRAGWDGAAKRVGNSVLMGLVLVLMTIFGLGFWQWLRAHGVGNGP